MMSLIKKILISIPFLLQVACSEAGTLPALHVHYSGQENTGYLYTYKPGCDKAYRKGEIEFPWKIMGDESLLGKTVKDSYWTRDGAHHVSYEMRYGVKGVNLCQYQVVPEIKATYENFVSRTVTNYKRTYQDWDVGAGPRQWDALDAFKSGKAAIDGVEKESWGIKKMRANTPLTRKTGKMLMGMLIGEPKSLGKKTIAGKSCEVLVALSNFAKNGIENQTCGWDPKDPNLPDRIILKKQLDTGSGLGKTEVAESVNDLENAPLSLLLPPAEWRNKPEGSYMKSDQTDGKWAGQSQQQALRKERAVELQKQKKQRMEKQDKKILEKLIASGLL